MSKIWGLANISLSPSYFNSLRLKYALDLLKQINGKVLEVGCGAGAFTRAVKKYRPDLKITGSDIDSKSIKLAKKTDSINSYVQADINKLPFNSSSFDTVLAFDVIEHLKNPRQAFSEINRVLKKNGVFHASIPLEGNFFTLGGFFSKIGIKPKRDYAGHIQYFTTKDILTILQNAGFSNVRYDFSGHCIYQLIDFSYFFLLSVFGRRTSHTVEGYVEILSNRGLKYSLLTIKILFSFLCYIESRLLKNIPGQLGHFTAYKK